MDLRALRGDPALQTLTTQTQESTHRGYIWFCCLRAVQPQANILSSLIPCFCEMGTHETCPPGF